MVLTIEAHQWFFMMIPRRMLSGGLGRNCILRSVGWNGFRDRLCLCMCVCLPMRVCVCVFGAWVHEWERAGEKDKRGVRICVHAFENFSDALPSPNPAGFHTLTRAAVPSPVHDAVSVQGHEVHLAAASRPHWGKEHLRNTEDMCHLWILLLLETLLSHILSVCISYLVISLTKELQPLSSLVHEDTIQVASLHRADLNGLFSPSHDLIWADMSCKAKCDISTWSWLQFLHMIHPFSSMSM